MVNGPKGNRQAHNDKRRNGPRDRGFTYLSYQELLERKQKGLCFKCGGAFHPMHQCPNKQLRVLVIEDEEEEGTEATIVDVEVDDSEEGDKGEISVLNLSHIAHGNHQTIKCQGLIRDVHVQIIVDSGATHNFVSQTLVHKMGWEVEETPDMKIKLGDGF
jgi:hypothetical protein